jgi:hypothetical protein
MQAKVSADVAHAAVTPSEIHPKAKDALELVLLAAPAQWQTAEPSSDIALSGR